MDTESIGLKHGGKPEEGEVAEDNSGDAVEDLGDGGEFGFFETAEGRVSTFSTFPDLDGTKQGG
ncbi:hypothetical protein FACS189472_13330 [Alphaproteobacteria bacterium]|nr:hypothetical protein FACS189472_13330 [Alphaproteobacteria bacterium]